MGLAASGFNLKNSQRTCAELLELLYFENQTVHYIVTMAKDRSLKAALDRQKGVDHEKERQKKLQKQAEKKKSTQQRSEIDIGALEAAIASAEAQDEAYRLANSSTGKQRGKLAANGASLRLKGDGDGAGWETDESSEAEEDEDGGINLETFEDESDSDSDEDETFYTAAASSPQKKQMNGKLEEEDGEDEEEEDIPLSDIESLASEDKGDVIPHQRLTINNTAALQRSLKSIALPSGLPFSELQAVTSAEPTQIPDIDDDLTRETAFYGQCLAAVREARIQLKKEGVPFSRPADYFAEMVKSEEQMGKIRSKQLDEAARKKASADARRQRDLKKFGKAVQVAKLQERDRAKRETLDKIGALKRSKFAASLILNNILTSCRTCQWCRTHSQ